MSSDYHHGELRSALLEAALELLSEFGPERISIRELSRRVGVSANAPYRHFADREALLSALAADGYRRAARRLAATTANGPTAVAATWSALAAETPGLLALMTGRPPGDGDPVLEGAIMEWLGEVARVLDAELGSAGAEQSVRRAVACWAAVHGLVALRSAGALGAIDDWMLPGAAELARRAARVRAGPDRGGSALRR